MNCNKRNVESYVSKYILDTDLSKEIDNHINFVLNHIDDVEKQYPKKEDQEIFYKQLGAIVFSCIEATWKYVIYEINKHCETRCCNDKKCPYHEYNETEELNFLSARKAFYFLLDTRIFGFTINDIDRIDYLTNLRNYIHLSKDMGESKKSITFDKSFAKELLKYFYEITSQLDTCEWYFGKDNSCLKDLDSNDFETTKIMREKEMTWFSNYRLLLLLDELFDKKDITAEEKSVLKHVNDTRVEKLDIKHIVYRLKEKQRRYKNEEEYTKALNNFYKKLLKHKKGKLKMAIEKEMLNKV